MQELHPKAGKKNALQKLGFVFKCNWALVTNERQRELKLEI